MRSRNTTWAGLITLALICLSASFSTASEELTNATVPRLVRFTGSLPQPGSAGIVGITFSLYKEEQGGAPLWLETQNVSVASDGRFTVLLGANHSTGLPEDLFAAGEARWLGFQAGQSAEQRRVLLVSVPYALKALDADTLGGKPLSAFLMATPVADASQTPASTSSRTVDTSATANILTGTANYLSKFSDATNLTNSTIFDSAGKIGIGTNAPESILDIAANSSQTVRFGTVPWALRIGQLQSGTQFIGIAVKKTGLNNNYIASSQNIATVNHTVMEFGYDGSMRLKQQAHQVDGTVLAPTTSFALLPSGNVGVGIDKPTQKFEVTGNVKIGGTGNGLIFPDGTIQKTAATSTTGGAGTITGVTAGTGLTGGGTSGNAVLSLNTTYTDGLYAKTSAANVFSGDQSVNGQLSTSGNVRITGAGSGVVFPDGTIQKSAANSTTGGAGTITAVSAGTGLSGGGTSGNAVLSLNTGFTDGRYATLATGNVFNGNQMVGGNLSVTGTMASEALIVSGAVAASGVAASGAVSGSSVQAHMGPEVAGGIAMAATADSDTGTGLDVAATAAAGSTTGIHAAVNSAAGFAGIFDNVGGGNILLGRVKIGDYWVKKFRVDGNGRAYANGYSTGGADFAESFAVNGDKRQYEPGNVLAIDETGQRRLTRSQQAYSTLVAGIYSTRPGVLASPYDVENRNLDSEVPLAVIGVVPCKVSAENGPIKTGDLLVSASLPGYAMKGTDRSRMLGAVVGKALQSLDSGTGVIEILVTLQ